MKIAKVRCRKKTYFFHNSNDCLIDILVDFLVEEVGFLGRKNYQDWLLFGSSEEAAGNLMELWKDDEEPENIWIYYEHTYGNEDVFYIQRDDLVDVIDRWQELVEERPKEIIISQEDDGKITLEGNNKDVFPQSFVFVNKDGKYRSHRASDPYLWTLNHFIEHDFSKNPYSDLFGFKEWINDESVDSFFEGWLSVQKSGDEITILFNPEHAKMEDAFVIKKEKLIKFIDDFVTLAKVKGKEITITDKDGEFLVGVEIL